MVAPGLVERRRRVIRESLKDGLRVWVERWVVLRRRREEEGEKVEVEVEEEEGAKGGVKWLVRRFTRRMLEEEEGGKGGVGTGVTRQKRKAQAKLGREDEIAMRWEERKWGAIGDEHVGGCCSQPTQVHVLGLKRFWEGVIKAASG